MTNKEWPIETRLRHDRHAALQADEDARWLAFKSRYKKTTQTPPATIKDIVDAIAARRGVTLYKESI